jgi:hypothetical protein
MLSNAGRSERTKYTFVTVKVYELERALSGVGTAHSPNPILRTVLPRVRFGEGRAGDDDPCSVHSCFQARGARCR